MSKVLSKEDLQSNLKYEDFVLDNGDKIRVRDLTLRQRIDFQDQINKAKETKEVSENMAAWLLCRTLVDENCKRLFMDGEESQVMDLLGSSVIQPLFDLVLKVSGLSASGVNDEVGKSEETQSDSSPTN